ncbi:uncharacterized protein K452DRAFT_358738 [Aplosporella prunicola CBS 121167]|uniref:Uncharacterized protein n=1 Tax=Aplosporella prunicola CBS 121167 TaxID=1176127 RepID=A0A6A6BBN4_9PEZI|nr:uncharacterized protein K452DRAFT_358738 [Aplosporella prunicola CBS 121167]KAF2141609.1 hypothetical protein K452DRAFT_358738 [Aplosporella prunicola CBS 121167]
MSYHKFLLLSLLGSVSAYTLTPYSDASCKKEIKNYSPAGKFDAGEGIKSITPAHWYDEANFPDQTVYWKVPELDSNCRVALMTQYAVENYGTLPGDRAPGKVILNVGEPGCYYSSLPHGGDIAWSYCCGSDECAILGGNSAALSKRSDGDEIVDSPEAEGVTPTDDDSVDAAKRSLEVRGDDDDWSNCEAVDVSKGWTTSGDMHMAANLQTCTEKNGCKFKASMSITTSTTVTSSSSQTINNTFNAGLKVSAGSNLFGLSATAKLSYEFSKSVTESQGMSVQNSTTFTASNELPQHEGTRAYMAFIPWYKCFDAKMKCGDTISDELEVCTPVVDGKQPQGEYTIVYTN